MKEITALNKALADLNSCKTSVDKIMAAESASAIRDITRYENVSEVARLANALSETSLAQMGMASALHKESLIEQAVRATASNQSLWDKTMAAASAASIRDIAASCEAVSGVAKLTNELTGTSYLKSISALHRDSLVEQTMKAAASSQSLWDKTIAAASAAAIKGITATRSYEAIAEAVKPQLANELAGTSYLKTAAALAAASKDITATRSYEAIAEAAKFANALPETVYLSLAEKAIDIIRNSRNIFIEDSNYLSAMAESVSNIEVDFKSVNTEKLHEIEAIFDRDSQQLSTAQNTNSFIQKFKNSNPILQVFILFFISLLSFFRKEILLPQVNSITANLLTPYVESYLSERKLTDREKISKIKNIPLTVNSIDTSSLRFVTGNNVRLRRVPSTNSEIIDEMALGQVVTVLSKKRNWIEVQYEYKDGEVMTGWTFTAYTKRFVK